jgi:hypothetical protein
MDAFICLISESLAFFRQFIIMNQLQYQTSTSVGNNAVQEHLALIVGMQLE